MPISQDSSIIPRQLTLSQDSEIIPANLPVTAGGSFAFRQSIYYDGGADKCETASSSTAWNPLANGNDVSFSCWARSIDTKEFSNGDQLWHVVDGTDSSQLSFSITGTDAYLDGRSRNVGFTSTYAIPSATQKSWSMYTIVIVEQARGSQQIKLFVNAVLVETLTISNTTLTNSSVNLSLGSGTDTLRGYLCEAVFSNYAFTDADVIALYNSGAGADPTSVLTSVHSYYPVTEAAGQTSGTIADFMGNADLTMSNFAAPNGTSNERP
jgi:hypothetical protein